MLAQSIWRAVPERWFKLKLRIAFHNKRLNRPDAFGIDGNVFVTKVCERNFRTVDPPFWVLDEAINRYELRHRIRPGETVIDAGAYHGVLTLFFAARVGPRGKVIAIEPDSVSRAKLVSNLELNGDSDKNEHRGRRNQRTRRCK